MAMDQQGRIQHTTDRMIRKAGQLHGQDRRDYKAAQEAGRGKSFMRKFQGQAEQMQGQIAKEAAPLGYRPPQQQLPAPQQPQPQGNPGGSWLDAMKRSLPPGALENAILNPQPGAPGQAIAKPYFPGRDGAVGMDVTGILQGKLPPGAQAATKPALAGAMMGSGQWVGPDGKPVGGIDPGFSMGNRWVPDAPMMIPRSQTRSPGIGMDGKRINYSRR